MKDIKNHPLFAEGMEAYLIGEWLKAKDSFISLDKDYPNNEHITFILGNISYSLGELEKAVEFYNKTISLSQNCGNAYYRLGVTFFKMGKFNESEKIFTTSLNTEGSDHVMVYYYLGLLSMSLGKDVNAIEYFDKLRVQSPQTKMAEFYEAQLKVKQHEFDSAIKLLEDFLNVSPDFAEAHHLLGVAYMGIHKNLKALGFFRKALELNPVDKRSSIMVDTLSDTDWP